MKQKHVFTKFHPTSNSWCFREKNDLNEFQHHQTIKNEWIFLWWCSKKKTQTKTRKNVLHLKSNWILFAVSHLWFFISFHCYPLFTEIKKNNNNFNTMRRQIKYFTSLPIAGWILLPFFFAPARVPFFHSTGFCTPPLCTLYDTTCSMCVFMACIRCFFYGCINVCRLFLFFILPFSIRMKIYILNYFIFLWHVVEKYDVCIPPPHNRWLIQMLTSIFFVIKSIFLFASGTKSIHIHKSYHHRRRRCRRRYHHRRYQHAE